ncbi:hypothetical protein PU629_14395 [Pullulanibacillus sp. KACC 23026]|uniref:hypothetical protein n=1 Tax=Pullulanibacillus sp. KACC 23026 TaxID=3028315 RepID=UPI0023B19706|nr:hypothetical protein [Pullulanibacillus sp. KACC 23026]WEG11347.1 hypothetical protein PU629_14395 [Pullulanibacillus sp. KACC 23026]
MNAKISGRGSWKGVQQGDERQNKWKSSWKGVHQGDERQNKWKRQLERRSSRG